MDVKNFNEFVNESVKCFKSQTCNYIKEKVFKKEFTDESKIKRYPNPYYVTVDGVDYNIVPTDATAVIKKFTDGEKNWYIANYNGYDPSNNYYEVQFYNVKKSTGFLKDTFSAPMDIFWDLNNHRYTIGGPISKKYHTVEQNSNAGSFCLIFEEGGMSEVKKTLKEIGFGIKEE